MKRLRLESESGFTLIELLVVVAIIGILAAIAIPQFAAYRRRGYDAKVKSDLRNAATAQEAYFAQNSAYKNGGISGSSDLPGYNQSADLTLNAAATTSGYVMTATATAGCTSGTGTFHLDSSTGTISGSDCS